MPVHRASHAHVRQAVGTGARRRVSVSFVSRSTIVLALPWVCLACTTHGGSPEHRIVRGAARPARAAAIDLAGREPDLGEARLFSRLPGSGSEDTLRVTAFDLKVDIAGVAARSRIEVTVHNPHGAEREAVLRVPIPPGAAVTEAV